MDFRVVEALAGVMWKLITLCKWEAGVYVGPFWSSMVAALTYGRLTYVITRHTVCRSIIIFLLWLISCIGRCISEIFVRSDAIMTFPMIGCWKHHPFFCPLCSHLYRGEPVTYKRILCYMLDICVSPNPLYIRKLSCEERLKGISREHLTVHYWLEDFVRTLFDHWDSLPSANEWQQRKTWQE